MCDNLGAVHTGGNPTSAQRAKHIDIRYFKIREWLEQQRLLLKHIDGVENPADMFTKALPPNKFNYYCNMLGLHHHMHKNTLSGLPPVATG